MSALAIMRALTPHEKSQDESPYFITDSAPANLTDMEKIRQSTMDHSADPRLIGVDRLIGATDPQSIFGLRVV
jgi:hypothetical protein